MGCCYSCKEDTSTQGADVNERTHLLVDPVSNNPSIQRVHTDDFLQQSPNSLPKKTDEQSALNRILQKTATNVIDVAALGPHNLEHHEYLERMKIYATKLQTVPAITGHWTQPRRQPCILVDIPAPDKMLSSSPIDNSDFFLITNMMDKANVALSEVKVEHKENLVVPFRIP
ncbi:late endosomal/lysosomal adaptor, MAPK and MTOR activator 1 [Lycorma delicatula]|uniref:late endosomal/lysosomal adaptor, MAPK and MTOR activator 1 n=1 Tax=Lycorma delicatula TaxID=130591 RepID=UPI003F514267